MSPLRIWTGTCWRIELQPVNSVLQEWDGADGCGELGHLEAVTALWALRDRAVVVKPHLLDIRTFAWRLSTQMWNSPEKKKVFSLIYALIFKRRGAKLLGSVTWLNGSDVRWSSALGKFTKIYITCPKIEESEIRTSCET